MASKRGAKPSAPVQPADAASSATPAPSATLHATLTELPQGQVLHRVHQDQYRADQFNPGVRGNARFSPIQDDQGQPIPTLYGGTTMDCALMETVFHDVPHTAGFKTFDKGKLAGQVHSTVEVAQPLRVVDLASVPLRKLGITRKQLIDTEKDQYPATRQWAEALHRQCPDAQGLSWVSRQDDSARAVVLFGDRIPNGALKPQGASRSLVDDGNAYDSVLDLADRIGVSIIPGKN
ncbi:RES family NAD+ phosphorylase [Salmonella enterica subsp. enterica serovar Mbandaka]|nr:RES family NAD+ phosphorylase [Salmonella enterica subsp. enterica serovar Mbandaka]EDU8579591.1 RES family NAD+ phosphorylase [Salmonella enterica subsp. enterica serovar Mbandaka]